MLRNERIYEALYDEGAFQALPAMLADAFDARSALIHWVHSDGEVANFAHSYFSASYMDEYKASFIDKDLWIGSAFSLGRHNSVFNISEAMPASRWERSEIYNDFIRPRGDDTFHCVGGAFTTALGTGLLGIHRGKSGQAFGDDALSLLEESASTLRRVLMVRGEIAAHRRGGEAARSALDIVGVPAITVRADRYIMHANHAAEAVLRRGRGLYAKNGYLAAHGETADRRLAAAIGDATASFQPKTAALTMARINSDDDAPLAPYRLTVTPDSAGRARALILFRDPDARDASLIERVRALYRLTQAEAELAVALAEGASLAEIAVMRRVREGTVRSQMKALAGKMQCSRQAEIAALVARIPPLHRAR